MSTRVLSLMRNYEDSFWDGRGNSHFGRVMGVKEPSANWMRGMVVTPHCISNGELMAPGVVNVYPAAEDKRDDPAEMGCTFTLVFTCVVLLLLCHS